jgi:hypothetical protein
MFQTVIVKGKYRVGDPIRQNLIAMGTSVGSNIEILFYRHDKQTNFEIVDKSTGDTIEVKLVDTESEAEDLWRQLKLTTKNLIIVAFRANKKIEAIKTIREDMPVDIRTAKNLIDSEYFARIARIEWHDIVLRKSNPS